MTGRSATLWNSVLRALRGPMSQPLWERPALLSLLLLNGILYTNNIGRNGWANSFYSAAVQSATVDWKAFFYGSLDWGNAITVDKPPLSLWVMATSARVFGLSPESVLLPQTLIGVLTTLMIYLLVRRNFSAPAALASATIFFTTPIITLLSRYNNPDPLMLLLMTAAAYAVVRGVESKRVGIFAVAGILLGLGFMTKQLQAMIILPALALTVITTAALTWRKRLQACLAALTGLILTGGCWITTVDLISPSDRPYIGGSLTNSALELTLGYNGLERLAPTEKDPTVGLIPAQFRSVDSDAGLLRLLNSNYSQEAGWLLIVAVLSCLWLVLAWKRVCNNPARRATAILALVWFVTTFLLLSYMGDGIHTYYTATLAPPLALVIGLGIEAVVGFKKEWTARIAASFSVATGTLVAWALLNSVEGWDPFLITSLLGVGLAGAALIAVKPPAGWINAVGCGMAAVALIAGPTATSIYNVSRSHSGSNPISGPVTENETSISRFLRTVASNDPAWAYDMGFGFDPGQVLIEQTKSAQSCTWGAATYPAQSAAKLQLASSRPVLAIGGFAGTDRSPTLPQFQAMVERGNICLLVWHQDHLELPGRSPALLEISKWVKSQFRVSTVDGVDIYDLQSHRE